MSIISKKLHCFNVQGFGDNFNMECHVCKQMINSHFKLACGICGGIYHTKCTTITNNMFNQMSNSDIENWICRYCADIFPFNICIDEELFKKLANNTYTSNSKLITRDCNTLIFNPFELSSRENDNNSWDDNDPDVNYFLQDQNLKNMCNSEYYDIEEFQKNILEINTTQTLSMIHTNIRSACKHSLD